MRLAEIDYDLPSEAIAQVPAEPRDSARLLLIRSGSYEHCLVSDLPDVLRRGDLLVVNETRVRSARVRGTRPSGAKAEVLLLRGRGDGWWEALVRPGRRLRPGSRIGVGAETLVVGDAIPGGRRLVRAERGDVAAVMAQAGEVPLPPYVRVPLADSERYQTVYSRLERSAAAPTAGLHFTQALRDRLATAEIGWATVDLQVGVDTFQPVRDEDPLEHQMHAERWSVPAETVAAIEQARLSGGRVVAVGTTTVRALESAATGGQLEPGEGDTRLYIVPGHEFRAVDALLTNFHAPRSSLLMLLTAVMGCRWREAYCVALREGYRFLSLGDAMIVAVEGSGVDLGRGGSCGSGRDPLV